MGYDTKTLTIQGAKLLAQEHGSNDKLMFDSLITSSDVVQAGTNLAELGISDFGTYLTFPINSLSYTDQQFTVKSVLSNNPSGDGKTNIISSDTPVKLVGIVGKIGSGDKTLISVAYATNGPYTIPAYDGTEISAAFTFVQAFDPTTDNSGKFVINPSAYALVSDLDKKVDKADAVTISGDQVIQDQKTFQNAPIDQKTGLPYLTEKDVPQPDLSNYATQQQLATKADASEVAPLRVGALHDGFDLDNEKTAGTFFSINKVTNGPGFLSGDAYITWVVSAVSSTEATAFIQMAYTQHGDMAIRNFVSGAGWGPWVKLANDSTSFHLDPNTGSVKESGNFPGLQVKGITVATSEDLNNYYHSNDSDQSALAAAKSATVPGIFWFEEA